MRTVIVGEPTPRHVELHAACAEALAACEATMRPGKTFGDVFDAHARVMDAHGMTKHRLNACGYSLGARYAPSWMDWPMCYRGNPVVIQPDMVIFAHMILMDSDAGRGDVPRADLSHDGWRTRAAVAAWGGDVGAVILILNRRSGTETDSPGCEAFVPLLKGARASPSGTAAKGGPAPGIACNMKLVAGNSNQTLARAIADYLQIELAQAAVRRFADQEIFVEIQENVRGEDVFVVQSTSFPANDNLMELLIIIDALRRASARRITAVHSLFRLCAAGPEIARAHADLGQARVPT